MEVIVSGHWSLHFNSFKKNIMNVLLHSQINNIKNPPFSTTIVCVYIYIYQLDIN